MDVVAIGLDEETVRPIQIDFRKNRHCLLVGQVQRGKTNTVKWIASYADGARRRFHRDIRLI